jgi:hypothetical protein
MKTFFKLGVAVAALAGSGSVACAPTYFHGSAPAQNGSVYVVGGKGGLPQAWVCPSAPRKGECQEIAVEEVGDQ